MTRQDKYTAEIEWFNAVEKHAHKEIDKLREGGRGHAKRQNYKPKKSIATVCSEFLERFLAFFAA